MQFLWSLLPGAREARNAVLIGYAWLAVLALWLGIPEVSTASNLGELADFIGRVGVGIAISFGAFMLGSLIDDVISPVVRARSARSFTSGSIGGLELLVGMGEIGRAELERLEASIDRCSAELTLRVALLIPLLISPLVVPYDEWWSYALVAVVAAALLFQIALRQLELRNDLLGSNVVRIHALRNLADEATKRIGRLIPGSGSTRELEVLRGRRDELVREAEILEARTADISKVRGLGRLLFAVPRLRDRYAPNLQGREAG